MFLIFIIPYFLAKLKSDGSLSDCCGLEMHWTDFAQTDFIIDLINQCDIQLMHSVIQHA